MSIVLGQRLDCGTVFTSLTATVDVVTVMTQESAANQVCTIAHCFSSQDITMLVIFYKVAGIAIIIIIAIYT